MTHDQLQVLQSWATIVVAITSVPSLIALVVYVAKTWEIARETARSAAATQTAARATEQSTRTSELMLAEMRAARFAETAPYMVAYFDMPHGGGMIALVVKNVGRSAAKDVCVRFTPPLISSIGEATGHTLPYFLTGAIPFFPPGHEVRTVLWAGWHVLGVEKEQTSYRVTITYVDRRIDEQHSEEYVLDLSGYRDTISERPTTLKDLNQTLEKIAKEQAKIAKAAEGVRETLEKGVVLANGSLLVEGIVASASVDERVRTKLAEVAAIWRSWRALAEDERYASVQELRAQLSVLGRQLLRLVAESEDEGLRAAVEQVQAVFGTLAQHHFYADGGQSFRTFDEIGDRLVASNAPLPERNAAQVSSDRPDVPAASYDGAGLVGPA